MPRKHIKAILKLMPYLKNKMLIDKSLTELASGLINKEFSSEEIVKECFDKIEKINSKLNAFTTVLDKDEVIKKAREKDNKRTENNNSLYGLPFIIKDSYNTRGFPTTVASNVLKNYISPYDATVYSRILNAGAILIAKTNMDAWGHGASSENNDYGPVRNPWDTSRVAGGSSGGNAAAISSRMTTFGIGEDTGGSIRNPSSWCNITGLKVTYGRTSRYGCVPYVSSFDTMGPMAKSAEDCALILQTMAGQDPLDATSSPKAVPDYSKNLQNRISGLVLGMPKECYAKGLDPEIKSSIEKAAEQFQQLGVKIKEISIPLLDYGVAVYYLIGTSETSSNLARYDAVRYGQDRSNFTKETIRRIMLGTYALSAGYYDAYYRKAQKGRTLFIKEYNKALSECDAILMPVEPMVATKIGELINDPIQNMLADIYTCQTPTGLPSLALPCGFNQSGMPIGMQLIGKMFTEEKLLNIGHQYQQMTDWHKRKPPLIEK